MVRQYIQYAYVYVQTVLSYILCVCPLSTVPIVPANYTVRLVQGISGDHEGLVEVFLSGEWGTVCSDSWDINDGRVVCRQIGLGDAIAVPGAAYFGRGDSSNPILLDEVACTGTEKNLGSCTFSGVHDCTHSEDAGVRCTGEYAYIHKYAHLNKYIAYNCMYVFLYAYKHLD